MKYNTLNFLILILTIFFLIGHGRTAYAGVAGYDDTTYKGVFTSVKCGDGVVCSKDNQALKIQSAGVKTAVTFTSGDATPSVSSGSYFKSFSGNGLTISDFLNGYQGEVITVLSQGVVTYDVTGTNLKCGTTDIVTAVNDITEFMKVDTEWRCIARIKASGNMN